ncbi:zinc-binding alcohol dehydrogenase family protein [Gracilibacillus saliphilus]|uniref:zinc-binding alcohol dehydrogenase family protein n=1 Tax=Gracilibacillus saliphilus TaxID=543890 RepID=UPI0013D42F14|nr:zinc-binding alcohol dehydrogenase family protein [Gracilibacillus saliphilus]
MQVIRCEEAHQFKKVEQEMPSLATDKDVLINIKYIGVCGTDIHAYNGVQPFFNYPRILGHELSGEVIELGSQVENVKNGDKVVVIPYMECGECVACRKGKTNCCTDMKVLGVHIDGGMREYISVPSDHVLKVNNIDLAEAALVEPLSIGAHAVRRSKIGEGDTVLVIGAGPIGLGVMKFAKLKGTKVIAMDVNQERLQFCEKWANVDGTVDALDNAESAISELTNGDYPDVVFDATGNKQSMTNAFQLVSHGGQLVYVGLVKDVISFEDPEFHKREMSLLGSRNATIQDFDYVITQMEKGNVDTKALITHRLQLADVPEKFEDILDPQKKVIKALVDVD